MTHRNAGTTPYVYSPTGSNGLFQTGSTSRYKTANGNTASIGTTTFTYDGFNRLATAQTAAETTTYTYNALGERVRKVNQNGLATVFHYGPDGELLFERDQAGNTKEYVWLDGRPLARIDNQTSVYYYHVDHLGTPQMMTDQSGTTVWRADYEPFGKAGVRTGSTVENNLRLPGQYFDRETGMHYNYYRSAYNPGTGRYEEADPIGLEGGLNIYSYVGGNPISKIDPLGLVEWTGKVFTFGAGRGNCQIFTLRTKCIEGKKTTVRVRACGLSFGAGFSLSGQDATFETGSDVVDPDIFNGDYFNAGLGYAPGFGLSFSTTILGGAGSPGAWSLEGGIDVSAGVTIGPAGMPGMGAKVLWKKTEPCNECSK